MYKTDRELLKMALDALLQAVPQTSEQAQEQSRSIVALQDRLAQPERVPLTDEQMREKFEELLEGSLFKRRADNPEDYWDGNVQDDWNLFRDAAKFAEAAHGIGAEK